MHKQMLALLEGNATTQTQQQHAMKALADEVTQLKQKQPKRRRSSIETLLVMGNQDQDASDQDSNEQD